MGVMEKLAEMKLSMKIRQHLKYSPREGIVNLKPNYENAATVELNCSSWITCRDKYIQHVGA